VYEGANYFATGSSTVNVVPMPGVDSTQISPPACRTHFGAPTDRHHANLRGSTQEGRAALEQT
jgi:hypothetical protein